MSGDGRDNGLPVKGTVRLLTDQIAVILKSKIDQAGIIYILCPLVIEIRIAMPFFFSKLAEPDNIIRLLCLLLFVICSKILFGHLLQIAHGQSDIVLTAIIIDPAKAQTVGEGNLFSAGSIVGIHIRQALGIDTAGRTNIKAEIGSVVIALHS